MKKHLLILFCLIILSGCTITRVDNLGYAKIMDKVLSLDLNIYNNVGKGYKYYVPRGIVKTAGNDYNDVLKRNDNYYYLYVDVVSYYYKSKVDYKVNEKAYYSSLINNGDKKGYIEINKKDHEYYIEMFYNYAKIETYVSKRELDDTISDLSYILSSLEFNDSLLKKLYEEGNLESKEEVYKLFDNKEEKGNFLEYVEEFDKYDGEDEGITKEEEIKVETTTTTTVAESKTTTTTTSSTTTTSN